MIEINGIEYRNLEEQVQKNKQDIEELQESGISIDLSEYATKEYVDEQIENIDIPDVDLSSCLKIDGSNTPTNDISWGGHGLVEVSNIELNPVDEQPSDDTDIYKNTAEEIHVTSTLVTEYGINTNNMPISGVPTPTADDQAANKAYVDANAGGGSLFELEYNFGIKYAASDFTEEDKAVVAEIIRRYLNSSSSDLEKINFRLYISKSNTEGIRPCKWWMRTNSNQFWLVVQDTWNWSANPNSISTQQYFYGFFYTYDSETDVVTIGNIVLYNTYPTVTLPRMVIPLSDVASSEAAVLPKAFYLPWFYTNNITLKTYNTGEVESTATITNAYWHPMDRKLIIYGSGLTLTNDNGAGDMYIGLTNSSTITVPTTMVGYKLIDGRITGKPDGGTETYAILAPNLTAFAANTEYVIRPLGDTNIDGTSEFTIVLQFSE